MSIQLTHLSFAFDPLGERLFDDLTININAQRTGIVGRNGSGKSTLLKLFTGELSPTTGSVTAGGRVARLRQDLLQRSDDTVAGVLGIDGTLAALLAIETGSIDQRHFDAVGQDWDIEARAEAIISRRIPTLRGHGVLTRTTDTLSGGELVQLGLAALELDGADIALLDEPTNNLDSDARAALTAAIDAWPGQIVVVSHDITLLNRMDAIVELHDGALRTFGGGYDAYRAQLDIESAAAEQSVRTAEQALRQQQRDREQVHAATARRERIGRQWSANKRAAPIAMNAWAEKSEKTRAADRKRAEAKVAEAREHLVEAEARVRDDDAIRIPVIDPDVARGRQLAELEAANGTLLMQGGDRWALVGGNGVGKTTLVRNLRRRSHRIGYLDQRLELPDGTVFDAVRGAAPRRLPHDTHALLARFLIRGDMVHREVGTLSGGERFRVALARVLLADPPPELIILDEPTNNLDLDSIDQLVQALTAYRGAILIVSHDHALLARLGLDRVLELTPGGEVVDVLDAVAEI